MVPNRDNAPMSFGSGAPMLPTTRPSSHGASPSANESRAFSHPPAQWSGLHAVPRPHATAPQRLHHALQPPPPPHSNGALRPSASTSYRVPWTRHSASSVSSSSNSSGSYSSHSRLGAGSSPRYSDLVDAINEASIAAGPVMTRRSMSIDDRAKRQLQHNGNRQIDVESSKSVQLQRRDSVELGSPMAQGARLRRSSPSPRQRQNSDVAKATTVSAAVLYPLAPMNQSANDSESAEEVVVEPANPPKKRVRYLRDTDRRNIIRRIENGEKQAALAREFGVTRAAICHIKKNRYEIISRYDLLVKTAKEMDKQESFGIPLGGDVMVHEVRSKSVLLLLTTLRDRRSPPSMFRRTAGRLIMILLEEALASLESEAVQVTTAVGRTYDGLQTKQQFCGVGIGSEGLPFLVLLNQMDPDAPRGSLKIEQTGDYRGGQLVWHVESVELPPDISEHKVFLFISTCSTGLSVCKAIEILRDAGVEERDISIVMIWCAADGLAVVCNRFPHVRVITAAIDSKTDDRVPEGLGDFVARYNDRIDPAPLNNGSAY